MADQTNWPQPEWLNVSRETMDDLARFGALVTQWTARINLISPASIPDIWNRHILDSAQLFGLAKDGRTWIDLGSGGGFPGIVAAIIARELQPTWRFNLVESDQRKTAFLRKAAIELGLVLHLHATRAESLKQMKAQTLTARALAPLSDLLSLVDRHLEPGGRAILPKGARAQAEIDEARASWSFDLDVIPSRTDPAAQILMIEKLRHV
jgi:16S rRNA (guanine527-N7)-methyltransferase